MGTPSWRKIVTAHQIPERPGIVWTPVLDYLTPGRLYRIRVEPHDDGNFQTWTPESSGACTADGDPALVRAAGAGVPVANAGVGCLIARIGGSTADDIGDKDRVVLFSVGRHCVFLYPAENARIGSLYLGVNDLFVSAAKLQGHLLVDVYDAL